MGRRGEGDELLAGGGGGGTTGDLLVVEEEEEKGEGWRRDSTAFVQVSEKGRGKGPN